MAIFLNNLFSSIRSHFSQLQLPTNYKKIFESALKYSPTPKLSPRSFQILTGLSIGLAVYGIIKFTQAQFFNKNPKDPEVNKDETQETKKPLDQETKKPLNQETKKPVNQEATKPVTKEKPALPPKSRKEETINLPADMPSSPPLPLKPEHLKLSSTPVSQGVNLPLQTDVNSSNGTERKSTAPNRPLPLTPDEDAILRKPLPTPQERNWSKKQAGVLFSPPVTKRSSKEPERKSTAPNKPLPTPPEEDVHSKPLPIPSERDWSKKQAGVLFSPPVINRFPKVELTSLPSGANPSKETAEGLTNHTIEAIPPYKPRNSLGKDEVKSANNLGPMNKEQTKKALEELQKKKNELESQEPVKPNPIKSFTKSVSNLFKKDKDE